MRNTESTTARLSPLLWALVLLLSGCAGDGRGDRPRIDLRELTPLYDFATRLDQARVVREVSSVELEGEAATDRLVAGWGRVEHTLDTGQSFVWAIADEATVELRLVRTGPTTLEFRCWPYLFQGGPNQAVEILVNGSEVASVTLSPGHETYRIAIPDGVLAFGENRVTFRFTYAESPSEHGIDDDRTLAAAFLFIRIAGGVDWTDVPDADPKTQAAASEFLLPPGQAVVYTLMAPADGVLDLAVAPGPGQPGAELRGEIRVSRIPGEAERLALVDLAAGHSERWQVRLGVEAGALVRIGFATWTDAEFDTGAPGMMWLQPRLFGLQQQLEPVTNLLLIVADTLRADHVGVYGSEAATPNIDAIAERGVVFRNAYSHIPITGPSHASLFTSLLPFEHGVHNNTQILDGGYRTLAELLRDRGRTTAAFVSLGVLKSQFGFDQGFEVYGDGLGIDWLKNAGELNAELFGWLDSAPGGPRFLWLHYSDPHEPYTPPGLGYPGVRVTLDGRPVATVAADGRGVAIPIELGPGVHEVRFQGGSPPPVHTIRFPNIAVADADVTIKLDSGWSRRSRRFGPTAFDTGLPATIEVTNPTGETRTTELVLSCKERLSITEIQERYRLEVEYLDREIGELMAELEARRLLEDTLVVFISDHGESLGEHGHVGHISQLYEQLIRVPMILSYPGRVPQGLVIEDRVALVDLLPTLADLFGFDTPTGSSGRSLVPLLEGASLPTQPIVIETYRPEAASDKRAVVVGDLKYIHSRADREWEELYDLARDPSESDDLAASRPDLVAQLREILDRRRAQSATAEAREAELTEQEAAQLRALGYLR